MPKHVINTSEDGDHASGNQLFPDAEIIAHRTLQDRMNQVAGSAQHLASPATLFDDCHTIDLDGMEVHLIHVGPCHHVGDTIVHVPREGVVFAGDVVYRECTPMGWQGSSEKWLQGLDLIVWLDPEVIVPGHGRPCGIEGAMEMKAYLEHVRDESRWCFERGQSALEAAKEIELGPYRAWRWPARLYANVESAYREFRNEARPCPRTRHAIATRWSNWRRRAGSRSSSDPPGNKGAGNGHADEHPAAATASRRSGTGQAASVAAGARGRLRGRRARRARRRDGGGGGRAPPAEHRHHPWR